jgi:hypothetical protein
LLPTQSDDRPVPVTLEDHHRMLQAGDNEDYSFLRHMQPVDAAVDDPRAP